MSDGAAIILKSTGHVAPGVDGHGYSIVDAFDVLDRLAKQLKVPRLRSFLYEDPSLYQDFAGSDYVKKLAKQKQWHRCTDGIVTIEALLGSLEGKDKRTWQDLCDEEGVNIAELRSDLRVCLKALQKAAKANDEFHLDAG